VLPGRVQFMLHGRDGEVETIELAPGEDVDGFRHALEGAPEFGWRIRLRVVDPASGGPPESE